MLPNASLRDPAAPGRLATGLIGLLLLWPLGHWAGVEPGLLLQADNLQVLGNFLAGFWPPAHDVAFLRLLGEALLQTLAIASVGLLLALGLAVPLALLGCEALSLSALGPAPLQRWRPALRSASRLLTLFLRGVPEVVWALLFVRAFGLGPAAAVLALALTYGGMLAKVFAEILDSTERGPARAILAAGGGRLAALAYGLLPMAGGELLSYLVYRWECALRAAVVMGLVGAGGLGQLLDQSMKAFAGGEVLSILLAFLFLTALADGLSWALRRCFEAPPAASLTRRLLLGWGSVLALAAALTLAWRLLGMDLTQLADGQTLVSLAHFAGEFLPPSLKPALLAKVASGLLETFALSLAGSLLAALAAALLALPAAGRCGPAIRLALRALLNLLRSVPELVWATLTVLAAGLGPFAGVLALAFHTTGVLGRLYAEALENAPGGPERALREAGAGRVAAFLYGCLPLAAPQWLAYGLYRWEINIRMAAVMGFVGAGGLGQLLYVELSLFRLANACTAILAMLLLAWLVDGLSAWLRGRCGAR
ncbi:phosphonate ABC transporter, permease protein PhnE [Uliginosibacterium aquaticum]|uniref:Phosphonate ABC transporter, permease protein PhnE n=1 Tax=Uliginosibacterium aquaticum TaxID=2731212 RepID=A0ABX2IH74_9RHOO|nr:phosphonate ABC transporter, permease protein PhnE [Uliginosibacterium aquaticum]NSL55642.1 phosphonate ABC transporter, permease protein PhnE [Uliginosibacterium aquaticum]